MVAVRETLYLHLGSDPQADVEFGTAGAEPRALRAQRGPLSAAAQLAPTRRVVVFVPGADVRLASVKVPARQPAKVLQAVPFALEEQIAEDVDALHFAIGPRQDDGSFPVAVVARARMEAWMRALQTAGLRPDLLVPDMLALAGPDESGQHWSALADGRQVIVRNGLWSGFVCDADDLPLYLDIADAARSHPLRLSLPGDSDRDWTRLGRPLNLLPAASVLQALASQCRPERAISLLQGRYVRDRDVVRHLRPWRLAAALLLAWLVVAGAGYALGTARLNAELNRQDQANLARYQQLFPEEKRIVDLDAQLDQQIKRLDGQGGGGLMPLLDALAKVMSATPGLKLGGMQFRDGALYLSLTAADVPMLERFRNAFAQQAGVALEVQSVNAESGGVQIRARVAGA